MNTYFPILNIGLQSWVYVYSLYWLYANICTDETGTAWFEWFAITVKQVLHNKTEVSHLLLALYIIICIICCLAAWEH